MKVGISKIQQAFNSKGLIYGSVLLIYFQLS